MHKISLLIFLFCFLLFRPYQMQYSGMMYSGDDYSYFAHATSLAFGQFPSYKKEYFSTTSNSERPIHFIGAGLMAAPFVYVLSWIDRLEGNPIVQQRRQDNILHSWSAYGFVLSSVFYLWCGCFLLFQGLREHFKENDVILAVFLMVLCQGIPLFAFRRPFFSHISEFFIISMLVRWMLVRKRTPTTAWGNWIKAVAAGAVIGSLALIRLNEIALVLVWPLVLFVLNEGEKRRGEIATQLTLAYGIAGTMIFLFYVLPQSLGHDRTYDTIVKGKLLTFYSPDFYLKRIWFILTGIDWGLVFTAPFILLGLASAIFLKYPMKRKILLSILPLLMNLYLIMAWKSQAGWYGYRYFVPAAAPLLIFPLTLLISNLSQRWQRRPVLMMSLILCLLPLLSMLAFEGNPQGLTLHEVINPAGVIEWSNNTYQLNVWGTLFHHPVSLAVAIFKGGPLFVLYGILYLFHASHVLSEAAAKYSDFSSVAFMKVLGVYLFLIVLMYLPGLRKQESLIPEK